MKCVIHDHVVLSRPPEGPLAAHIGAFAKSQSVQGYALASVHRQVLLAACFSRWLQQEGVALLDVTSAHPSRYLRYRTRHARPCPGDTAAPRHLMEFLRREGMIAAEAISVPRLTPVERCMHAYEQYLRDVRALASATIVNYADQAPAGDGEPLDEDIPF